MNGEWLKHVHSLDRLLLQFKFFNAIFQSWILIPSASHHVDKTRSESVAKHKVNKSCG